jgi:hypothetical protein
MPMLSAFGPVLTTSSMTAVDGEHFLTLPTPRPYGEATVNTVEYGLWDPKCSISSFVARTRISDHKHAQFVLEQRSDLIRTQVPHLGDLIHGVMTFG